MSNNRKILTISIRGGEKRVNRINPYMVKLLEPLGKDFHIIRVNILNDLSEKIKKMYE